MHGLCFGGRGGWLLAGLIAVGAMARSAAAQSSSLLGNPASRRPLTLANCSWTYQPTPEPKQWKVNDTLTVIVQEKARMGREGQIDQRKKAEGSLALTDWVLLDGFSLVSDPQSDGEPKVAGILDNKYRAQANLQNRDYLETEVQCVVQDIRPNGLLVIEGHSRVQIDDEEWEISISGIISPDDILPNKTIKSEKIAEKRILRRSAGHGRDGLRRGWFMKLLDRYAPF
ncbi:MAG: flagellar basal body L-ring protein FlgH [Thermoguttaceae bacterium]